MSTLASKNDARRFIAETIKDHPVVLFMKGNPALPQCGFSAATVQVLRSYNVVIYAVDVLPDPILREEIKAFSDWPTIPQLYVDGTFVGGCDIVREMHTTGELGELIAALEKRAGFAAVANISAGAQGRTSALD